MSSQSDLLTWLSTLTPAERDEAIVALASDPVLQEWLAVLDNSAYANFRPRPDRPEAFDQQQSFIENQDRVAFIIGGNASGTTEAAAYKTAQFLLRRQPPPRPNTPFWIISNTYDQCCGVCWAEKLHGHGHIPESEIDWPRVRWKDKSLNHPMAVPLKPWPASVPGGNGKNSWTLHFKSYEQGRQALQAASIGGFWFSEQFPMGLFLETLRGCREYMFPGGQFAEFTPIEPELCLWIEKVMDSPPPGWAFYRANTECNRANLAEGWFEDFFGSVPDEMIQTRMTGALATFENVIYPSFSTAFHVIPEGKIRLAPGLEHYIGTDWGASMEHPQTSVFGARDNQGDWLIYDEYWSTSQSIITPDHAAAVIDIARAWGWKTIARSHRLYGRVDMLHQDQFHRNNFADPARPGELTAFNDRGVPTFPASNNVWKGIGEIRTLLKPHPKTGKPRLLVSSRCKHLIEEFRKYRWKRGKKGTDSANILNPAAPLQIPLKRDDDTIDALRYMILSAAQNARGCDIQTERIARSARESVQLEAVRAADRGARPGIGISTFGFGRT